MQSLKNIIPSSEVLLALPPEQLAGTLLKLTAEFLKENKPNPLFYPDHVANNFGGNAFDTNDNDQKGAYPKKLRDVIDLALSEAWHWLSVNGLIYPPKGADGGKGYFLLSKRGIAVADQNNFEKFLAAAVFPKSLLHPQIADRVWAQLIQNDLDTAVFLSFKAVEEAVRAAGKYGHGPKELGIELMRSAFNPENGPLTDLTRPAAERERLRDLFVGAIGSYKNPHSHRTIAITDVAEANEMVMFASHLLRIIETRSPLSS